MKYSFHLIFEKGDKYVIGYCPEVPGANGQGESKEECRQNLLEAIDLILETRAEEGQRGIPEDAEIEILTLG